MLEFRNLPDISMRELHSVCADAFSQYVVDMKMSFELFEEMLITRGFHPEHSYGCFDGDQLVAFIFVGCRHIAGQEIWYDISTGVVPARQKQGLGDRMLRNFLRDFSDREIGRFVLEVLVENKPAYGLYKKHGFQITRRLNCYEAPKADFTGRTNAIFEVDKEAPNLKAIDETAYNVFAPSWQNSLASWRNAKDKHEVHSLWQDDCLAAYGIINRERGRVLQIGFAPQIDRLEATKAILPLLGQATAADQLVFLNVEEGAELERILMELGFTNMLDQYEMEYVCK